MVNNRLLKKNVWLVIAGLSLCTLSIFSIVNFNFISQPFLSLSPDGSITPFMMLLLKILLISLGLPGICIIFSGKIINLLRKIHFKLTNIKQSQFLIGVLLTGFLLRVLSLLLIPSVQYADFISYDELGYDWALRGGYYNGEHLTGYWPPGYPFYLSRIFLMFGHHLFIALALNIILGLVIIWFSYLLAKKMFGEDVSRWAILIMALFPGQILYTNLLASEMLFQPLFLGSLLLTLYLHDDLKGSVHYSFLTGLMLGLAALTRSIVKLLFFPMILYWYLQTRNWRRTLKYALLSLAGFILVVLPWMLRNEKELGSFSINTNTGINLYQGNQPSSGMGYNAHAADEFDLNDPTQEAWIDSVTTARSWEYIKQDPIAFLKRGIIKVAFFYALDTDALNSGLLSAAESGKTDIWVVGAILTQSFYLLILLGAAIGLLTLIVTGRIFENNRAFFILLIILYWTAVHFLFYGMGRYHFPIIPMLTAFACYTIVRLWIKDISVS